MFVVKLNTFAITQATIVYSGTNPTNSCSVVEIMLLCDTIFRKKLVFQNSRFRYFYKIFNYFVDRVNEIFRNINVNLYNTKNISRF